jgi:hypothetical protein
MSGPKKPSDRATRRAAERASDKLLRERERLAALDAGGGADHPIEVASASLVEPRATSLPCLRCDGTSRVDEHIALVVGERRLRLVRLACPRCGARREVYFRIGTPLPS